MPATVLDGKNIGRLIEEELQNRIISLQSRGVSPHLAVVIVGDDPASHVYVRIKKWLVKGVEFRVLGLI